MLDFTSALYLGFEHASQTLAPWSRLTEGVPATLREADQARALASRIAALVGCERASLTPSTLHAFWDLFGQFHERSHWVCLDGANYPIAGWGAERAGARGVRVQHFRHLDPDSLQHQLQLHWSARQRPVVATDGFCAGCGRHAPLREYLALVEQHDGLLVVDDTQALGVFGREAGETDFGAGGGGAAARAGLHKQPRLLLVASMAKAFGAPLAYLAGTTPAIAVFEARSETRMYSSPPAHAALAAAARALTLNRSVGASARARLARNIEQFRAADWQSVSVRLLEGYSPVQRLAADATGSRVGALRLQAKLQTLGVRSLVQRARCRPEASVTCVLSALHEARDIDRLLAAIFASARATSTQDHRHA
jgi:8-amino-7-oxononanoate synthase